MKRTPNPPNSLILTQHIPSPDLPILAPLTLNQQFTLLHYLLLLQVPDADRFLAAIDVMGAQDGVFVRSWGDMDANLRVGLGEAGEELGG